jgi:hypothetical protein
VNRISGSRANKEKWEEVAWAILEDAIPVLMPMYSAANLSKDQLQKTHEEDKDALTKPLPTPKVQKLTQLLGLQVA